MEQQGQPHQTLKNLACIESTILVLFQRQHNCTQGLAQIANTLVLQMCAPSSSLPEEGNG